jgi:hypothetical protein
MILKLGFFVILINITVVLFKIVGILSEKAN